MRRKSQSYYLDLVLKFLAGRCIGAEKIELDIWLAESERNRELFNEIRSGWLSEPMDSRKAEDAFQRVAGRLNLPPQEKPANPVSRFSGVFFLRAAAVFTGFLLISFIAFLYFQRSSPTIYRTGYAEVATFRLPDGSSVTLNANSSLTLPENWLSQPVRKASLEGEAFFEVQKLKQAGHVNRYQKFIVSAGKLDIEVLGTAFNVNSRGEETRVVLNSGSIKLKLYQDKQEIMMQPGDYVTVDYPEDSVVKKKVDAANYSKWKKGELYFDGTTIPEIRQKLKNDYDINIAFEDSLQMDGVQLKGTFPANDLEILLNAIADVTNTVIVRNEGRIYYK